MSDGVRFVSAEPGSSGSVGKNFAASLPAPPYPWPSGPSRSEIDPNVSGNQPISHGG